MNKTNNLDKQYINLLQDILKNGVKKSDRTGTGTISVFGRQIVHDMSEGFPLLTTKKVEWNSIIRELIWFLRGDTNIKYLVDNGCNIWNGDAYKNYSTTDCAIRWMFSMAGKEPCPVNGPFYRHYTKEEFVEKIKTDKDFAKEWGNLGPIYGKQWRKWEKLNWAESQDPHMKGQFVLDSIDQIDQISDIIHDLKTNPDSRRLIVNAWNVGEVDDMVLPPCHYGFQLYTSELSEEELYERFPELKKIKRIKEEFIRLQSYENAAYYRDIERRELSKIPTRKISLMWHQRSVDTFLGLPFNIASYGLLLELIAKEVNMIPDKLIGNLGDVHLYSNHMDAVKEQIGYRLSEKERFNIWFQTKSPNRSSVEQYEKLSLIGQSLMLDDYNIPHYSREPYPLPSIFIADKKIDDIKEYNPEDILLENYQSHKAIKAPLSN
jgi:thymidylate synthase